MELSGESAGEGIPVVLLHGLTATRRYVVMGSRSLERSGHRVLSYDARGHGRSTPAPAAAAYGYGDLAGDLAAVLDELEVGRAVLVGASMGAHTVLRLALDAPERVAALIAITPGYDPASADDPERLARWDALADGLRRGGVEGFLDAYGEPAVSERWHDTVRRVLRQRLSGHEHPEAVADALSAVPRSHPFASIADLGAIEAPTVVVASRDEADPEHPFDAGRSLRRRHSRRRAAIRGRGRLTAGLAGRPPVRRDRRGRRARRTGGTRAMTEILKGTPVNGRVVVVTGASSGIGAAAAVELAGRGATVVPVGRDAARLERIARRVGGEPLRADFASLRQVRELARELLERHARIDVLVNNAGLVTGRRELTEDGYEKTFAVNHLAPFLLTNLLLERLRASAPARVVTTSSGAHGAGRLDFDDLQSERSWSMMRAYGTSKLANVLFTRGLAVRVDAAEVTANCLHPGVINTRLGRGAGRLAGLAWTAGRPLMRSPASGAATIVYLATSEEGGQVTGGYYESSRPAGTSAAASDPDLADRLWHESARLVGLPPGRSG